jgi:hypothetical protein
MRVEEALALGRHRPGEGVAIDGRVERGLGSHAPEDASAA